MIKQIQRGLSLFLVSLAAACSHGPVIAPDIAGKVDTSLTVADVRKNPDAYKGRAVLWGGEVLQIIPRGSKTFIEIAEMSLDRKHKPDEKTASGNRFFILIEGETDFSKYERGNKTTIAGEVLGTVQEKETLDGIEKNDVVLSPRSLHVWRERAYAFSSPPDERGSWEYRHYSGILRY